MQQYGPQRVPLAILLTCERQSTHACRGPPYGKQCSPMSPFEEGRSNQSHLDNLSTDLRTRGFGAMMGHGDAYHDHSEAPFTRHKPLRNSNSRSGYLLRCRPLTRCQPSFDREVLSSALGIRYKPGDMNG